MLSATALAEEVGTYPVQIIRWRKAGYLSAKNLDEMDRIIARCLMRLRTEMRLPREAVAQIVEAIRSQYLPDRENWLIFSDNRAFILNDWELLNSFVAEYLSAFTTIVNVDTCA